MVDYGYGYDYSGEITYTSSETGSKQYRVGDKVCLNGDKYKVISVDGHIPGFTPEDGDSISLLKAINNNLVSLISLVGETSDIPPSGKGGYKSIVQTIARRESKYEIFLGVKARNLHIRGDQPILIQLNNTQNDDIRIELSEYPFSLSDLTMKESVHTIFVTTEVEPTTVKIVATGLMEV